VFCSERYGLKGEDGHRGGATSRHDIGQKFRSAPGKSRGPAARKLAGVSCRWHDARHSFVSPLAEGQASDAIPGMSGALFGGAVRQPTVALKGLGPIS
jgi:hypothetical protein